VTTKESGLYSNISTALIVVPIFSFSCPSLFALHPASSVTSFVVKSFEIFTAVMIQVEVFWVVTSSYGVVVIYQCFVGLCCLRLQGEEVRSSVLRCRVILW
jgi:hypothetical protein